MLVAAGYGASFFANGNLASTVQYDNINAQAEGTFYLSGGAGPPEPGQATLLLSTVTFGYARDFQTSLMGNYYESNKGYAKVVYLFGGKTLLQLDGHFEALGYPQPYYNSAAGPIAVNAANGSPSGAFTNYRAGGTFFAEYRFSDSFAINGTVDYAQTLSNTVIEADATRTAGTPAPLYDLNWRRLQGFLGARWFL
jgi:hypothetical protein